jgi:light-regulated signal transduction histidine kinase (bacteriophytochrome)
VSSFLSQLEKKYMDVIDERGKQYIHFAIDGANRMKQLILDLLEFSRVGKVAETTEAVDLNKLVAEVLILLGKQIEEKKASIICGDLPVISAFKTPVRQVFQNLISNSLKYQQKDVPPCVTIFFTETKEFWQFSVADNGIGISDKYFEKIFVLFQRLHNKDEYSGTGIGLAITKKIIENMGGEIWLNATEGKGSTFYFTIPKKLP